jgi:hypothetical protein
MSQDTYSIAGRSQALAEEEDKERLIQRLRQYLELRNLTLLIGNGCSIPLGAPLIHDVANLLPELKKAPYRLSEDTQQGEAVALLEFILAKKSPIGVEAVLTLLANIQANEELIGVPAMLEGITVPAGEAISLERLLKKWLFQRCSALTQAKSSELQFHEELLRRILLRSTTLPRAKIFTTNYDLLIERALDNLGVLYFDGFLGTIDRTLRTESYHYDLYFPGETTEGRVSRVDRVLHFYKLHGSINWRRRHTSGADDVVISHTTPEDQEFGDVMIYPSPLKVTEMNGYPYSEMFRHFSAHLRQPQSALITIGYRFQDEHINRLIYQALSIPSFVLIIVIPSVPTPTDGEFTGPEHEIWRLSQLGSKRILVLSGGTRDGSGKYIGGAGTLQGFATTWLPDIDELSLEAQIREETRRALQPLRERTPSHDN